MSIGQCSERLALADMHQQGHAGINLKPILEANCRRPESPVYRNGRFRRILVGGPEFPPLLVNQV